MPHFTKQIEGHNFVFNRIYTVTGTKYHISVRYQEIPHYFMMDERNGGWLLSPKTKVPEWIKSLEKLLEKAILEHMESGQVQ